MRKVDFKKRLDCYRAKEGEFRVINVPPLTYLMVDGYGDPNTTTSWSNAVSSLYPVAYALKFFSKNDLDRDYVVMPLQALWWADDMDAFTSRRNKSQWRWTAMIMVPEWTTQTMFENAVTKAATKNADLDFRAIRMEALAEGTCVQSLHIGSYDNEGPVLQQMHEEFIPAQRLIMTGKHHEIYLSDARRVKPDKLRTILRQPVIHI